MIKMITFIDLSENVGNQSLVINFDCEVVGFRFFELDKYHLIIFNRV